MVEAMYVVCVVLDGDDYSVTSEQGARYLLDQALDEMKTLKVIRDYSLDGGLLTSVVADNQ